MRKLGHRTHSTHILFSSYLLGNLDSLILFKLCAIIVIYEDLQAAILAFLDCLWRLIKFCPRDAPLLGRKLFKERNYNSES